MSAVLHHPLVNKRTPAPFVADAVRSSDPTGTMRIRRQWRSEFARRWRTVEMATRDAVVALDLLGLQPAHLSLAIGAMSLAGQSEDRTKRFQAFFDGVLQRSVLDTDGEWMRRYLQEAWRIAISRARRMTKSNESPVTEADKLGILHSLTVMELQGVCEAVSQRVMRIVGDGLLRKVSARKILTDVIDAIRTIGRTRSETLVEALVVRTHSEATLDLFESARVTRVGLLAELIRVPVVRDARGAGLLRVLTAGDLDVCPVCEDLENQVFSIDEARGVLPAHPRCRCAWVPTDDARFADPEDLDDALNDDWNEADHPREPAGSSEGGQFTSGGVILKKDED